MPSRPHRSPGSTPIGIGRVTMQTVEPSVTTARHPLDPLTPAEIEAASSTLKRARGLADSARFVYVTLREPPKEVVLSFRDGDPIDREAFVLLRERSDRKTYEAVVSISAGGEGGWGGEGVGLRHRHVL